tara:strand:+ start:182 stop:487 length:306 start_codon:yes stop_codon:yes gene_type:complete
MDTSLRLAQVAVAVEDLMVLLEHQEVMGEIGNQCLDHYQDLVMEDLVQIKVVVKAVAVVVPELDIEEDLVELLVSMNHPHPHLHQAVEVEEFHALHLMLVY